MKFDFESEQDMGRTGFYAQKIMWLFIVQKCAWMILSVISYKAEGVTFYPPSVR